MVLLVLVVMCYTICALSDKFAVAKAKLTGSEFGFLMAAATSLFMLPCLFFVDFRITPCWQSVVAIILICASKMLEFLCSAKILTELSAFELKAWLGVLMFLSYFTDMIMGKNPKLIGILWIIITAVGLVLIAKSGQSQERKVNYRRIILPLIVYLAARFGYALVINWASPHISSTATLFLALVLMAVILLPSAKPVQIFKNNKLGFWVVSLTKIPNVAGLLLENAIIAQSLINYSFIQPMILCTLFIIALVKKEQFSKTGLAGSLVAIAGVVGFQIASLI